MSRHQHCASVFVQAVALWVLAASSSAGSDTLPAHPARPKEIELLHLTEARGAPRLVVREPVRRVRHRFSAEMNGARAQAEDWLRTSGFSLLESRDSEGRRSYELISGTLASQAPAMRFHTRIGRPRLSSGLRPSRKVPALGLTIPGDTYTVELEGLRDSDFGWALMGSVRWGDPHQRVQYGIALPIMVGDTSSVGALLQLRVRFGD